MSRNPAYRLSPADLADEFDRQSKANQADADKDEAAAARKVAEIASNPKSPAHVRDYAMAAVTHHTRMASFGRGRATAFASAAQQLRDLT